MIPQDIYSLSFKDINELFYRKTLIESQTIEIKRHLSLDKNGKPENREFAKDVTAMANAEVGVIFLGIDEKEQEICGVDVRFGNQKIEDWISNVLNDLVDKTLSYQIHQIPVNDDDARKVIVLNIAKGTDKPYYVIVEKKSLAYVRKGSSVFAAKLSDIAAMYKAHDKLSASTSPRIKQHARGKNIQQIGQNFGKIITTKKIQHVTEVVYDKDAHITDQQAKLIKDKVDEIVEIYESAGKFKDSATKGKFYATTWSGIKNRFSVTKYTLLQKHQFDECMQWLQSQIAAKHRPVLRKHNNPVWKRDMYASIYAKSRNDWNMDKDDLYEFASSRLKLKNPISSLKDLSDVNLKKLYGLLFSK
ncbi:RNA-binding domain-containing protein [Dyadobacter sp. LHD-138]|uniref:RNA-binding domain-containing protein n=1 Tax=Dyadobacter sp. LHD-138 TaxID=3071413 RepID=UPI0027DF532F|nr:RNA-binding domain-containing protein [Dyadobacter sp. LHD-138]MDQ6482508.1 putative DNA binding domain-containing protein [Dyadobacter sp. LHD-138]